MESPRSPGGSSAYQAAPQFAAPSPPFGIDTVDRTACSLEQLPQVRDVDSENV